MSAQVKMQHYDESLLNFYDEQLIVHADAVYRLAYTLTLSLDGALQLVNRTFQVAAEQLERIQADGEQSVLQRLVATLWRCFRELGNARFHEAQSSVSKVLKSIAVDARAALIAVDVIGLSPAEVARAFEWGEIDLRQKLATARRTLLTSNLS